MSLQGQYNYDQTDPVTDSDFYEYTGMSMYGDDEFAGADFGMYPIPDLSFGDDQLSDDNVANAKIAGGVTDVLEPNVETSLPGSIAHPDAFDPSSLALSPTDMHLPSDETSAVQSIDPSLLSSSTPLESMNGSMGEQEKTSNAVMTPFPSDAKSAYLPAQHPLCAHGFGIQRDTPAWKAVAPATLYSQYLPPPASHLIAARKYSSQLTKRKQDLMMTSSQSSKRRPAIPESFMAHIDIENPPRRDSEVHDIKGCKDTTLANDYYYRISNSLPSLKIFFDNGTDLTYRGPEFHRDVEFTGDEFMRYLRLSPRSPVLIIQMQPQKRNHRYIRGGHSFKCRSRSCPDPRKTIWKGHFRVCITEFYDAEGHWVNPFQSAAGYLHLYCLENMLNLGKLMAENQASVCPEVRNFKHEPSNPMELSKLEQRTFQKWVDEFVPRWTTAREQHTRTQIPQEQWLPCEAVESDRLYHRLTAAHLEKNPGTVKMAQKRRKQAEGKKITAHVDQCLGDVGKHVAVMKRRRDAYVAGMNDDRQVSPAQAPEPSPIEHGGKRRRFHSPSCHSHPCDLRSAVLSIESESFLGLANTAPREDWLKVAMQDSLGPEMVGTPSVPVTATAEKADRCLVEQSIIVEAQPPSGEQNGRVDGGCN